MNLCMLSSVPSYSLFLSGFDCILVFFFWLKMVGFELRKCEFVFVDGSLICCTML